MTTSSLHISGTDFATLTRQLERPLRRFLAGWCWNHADVEDVAQEALLRAWRHRDRFCGGSFTNWLFRIARNQAASLARNRARIDRLQGELALRDPDRVPQPEDGMIRSEDRARVRRAVENLPTRWRDILGMRYEKGLEVQEIARHLGDSPNAIALVLFRARRKLRRALN